MTITLQLSPQIEESLLSRARQSGMSVDAYVQSVIENSALGQEMLAMSPADFEAALDELSAGSERLPILPPEAFTREGIYRDG
jgi:hypothetical protein